MGILENFNYFFGHRGFRNGNPQMTRRERWFFHRHLRGKRFLLEFGAGGSTLFAARCGVPKIVSVESNPDWTERLLSEPTIATAVSAGRLSFHLVAAGPTDGRGRPLNGTLDWNEYHSAIWSRLDRMPDIVLIDGRERVACAEAAAMHVPRSTVVLFHDYWPRTRYHRIGGVLECVESAGSFAAFRRRLS